MAKDNISKKKTRSMFRGEVIPKKHKLKRDRSHKRFEEV